ncbi:MAG TPA: hypothetical protein VFV37_10940 [Luteibaculaceae bacterium]|nr:hypothetical protein [Luteibaculaceae bacterium]
MNDIRPYLIGLVVGFILGYYFAPSDTKIERVEVPTYIDSKIDSIIKIQPKKRHEAPIYIDRSTDSIADLLSNRYGEGIEVIK